MYSRAKTFFFFIKSQIFSALIERQNVVKASKNIELFSNKKSKSSVKYWAKGFLNLKKKFWVSTIMFYFHFFGTKVQMILCDMTLEYAKAYFFNGVSFLINKIEKGVYTECNFLGLSHFFVQLGTLRSMFQQNYRANNSPLF